MDLFYCPNCEKEDYEINIKTLIKTIINCRGGYGRIITHYVCPECGNLLAGYIANVRKDDIDYYKSIIKDYNPGGLYFYDELLRKAEINSKERK